MLLKRRRLLQAGAALAALPLLSPAIAKTPRKAVIVGGGWGGLSAARQLRSLAPELDVTLVERQPAFWSCPLSNHWLTGRLAAGQLTRDYTRSAQRLGYRFIQADVRDIDRDARQVVTSQGKLDYDWLVLAVGIRHDYAAWFGDDAEAAALARRRYPAAYAAGDDFAALRAKLEAFRGGDLLMTVPPAPYRCPPAVFERAVLIAGWFAARKIPARLVIVDPNPPFQEFQRIFREEHAGRIDYRSQTPILGINLEERRLESEFEDFGFDDAILMPPQQAGDLAWRAGLIGRDGTGRPTGWGTIDRLRLASPLDERIFLIGDMVDRVSNLFGHYPKSAQIAVRQGQVAAGQIAAAARGTPAAPTLPDSTCHIATRLDPPAALRLDFDYRLRGDGELVQAQKVVRDRQPRGEDLEWLQSLFGELFG